MLLRNASQGSKLANSGVRENNIDSPLQIGDGFVETIEVGHLGNVSLNAKNVAADCLYGLIEFLLATAGNENISALFDEKLCRGQSNPFCSAGDDGDLTFELFRHRFSPLLLRCNKCFPLRLIMYVCQEKRGP